VVSDISISCSNFTLDWRNDEFIKNIQVYYDDRALREMTFTTNLEKTLTKGSHDVDMTFDEISYIAERPLLAFYGLESLT